MKTLAILGAGTAGTILANRLERRLPADWEIVVVDPEVDHLYQPGLVFVPFGLHRARTLRRARAWTLRAPSRWRRTRVLEVRPDRKRILLEGPETLDYDLLVIASGSHLHPEETEGLYGDEWRRSIHEFYTLDGALALRESLSTFEGGKLVVNPIEMPIKSPIAPLEFAFLADDYFERRGIRDDVTLSLVTPLHDAFTKPLASKAIRELLERRDIAVVTDFATGGVHADGRRLLAYDGRAIDYDLLVTVPTHKGASYVERSGLGDELRFVPTDPHSLRAREIDDAFVLGDATDLPTSKGGSVAHFQSEVVAENVLCAIDGREPTRDFDGHANFVVETGHERALFIDHDYGVEPRPGRYPWPLVGPLSVLRESRANHAAKRAFETVYWDAILPGKPVPLPLRGHLGAEAPS